MAKHFTCYLHILALCAHSDGSLISRTRRLASLIKRNELRTSLNYYYKEGQKEHHQRRMYRSKGHQRRMKAVKAFLSKILNENALCLEVGCAEGWYTHWMSDKVSFVVGIDISIPKLKRAVKESNNPKNTYIQASWDSMPFKDSAFDIVLFSEGPEHSSNPKITLREIARVTGDHGHLTISASMASYVKNHNKCGLLNHGHLREFTPSSLRKLVEIEFDVVNEFHSLAPRTSHSFLRFYLGIIRFIKSQGWLLAKIAPYSLKKLVYQPVPTTFGLMLARKR